VKEVEGTSFVCFFNKSINKELGGCAAVEGGGDAVEEAEGADDLGGAYGEAGGEEQGEDVGEHGRRPRWQRGREAGRSGDGDEAGVVVGVGDVGLEHF